jgi:hypothetical protein
MSVIYVADTGHALAAVTRTADSTVPFDLSHLGGGQLIVTNSNSVVPANQPGEQGEEFLVPSAVLKVTKNPAVVIASLLSAPLSYAVDNDVPQQIGSPPAVPAIALSATQVQITGGPFSSGSLNLWLQVQEQSPADPANPEIRVSSGQIPAGAATVAITLTGSPGGVPIALPTMRTYSILLLLAGYPAVFASKSI